MSIQGIVDLELDLRPASSAYAAEVRLSRGTDSVSQSGPFALVIDPARLLALRDNPEAYGQALTGMVFADAGLREAFAAARGMARAQNTFLRVRLNLRGEFEELDSLNWELLCLPGAQPGLCERLTTREDILFSRYLPSQTDAPPPAPQGGLRALVAIANPTNLSSYGAPGIPVAGEVERARAGLAGMVMDWLPAAPSERCTLNRLVDRIPGHDVLYLVCHGKMIAGTGQVLLENEDGSAARVSAVDLARRLAGSLKLPRLAILVVCESAGGAQAVRGGLGPLFVKMGIPAVVAMQGALSFASAGQFLPRLFAELQKDGIIDRAVAVARRSVMGQFDETAPVLFMSLTSGRLWAQGEEPPRAESLPGGPSPAVSRPAGSTSGPVDQLKLYKALVEAFTLEDLEGLCFVLQVDWESIRGETKTAKARAMIQYFANRGRLERLAAAVQEARPDYPH